MSITNNGELTILKGQNLHICGKWRTVDCTLVVVQCDSNLFCLDIPDDLKTPFNFTTDIIGRDLSEVKGVLLPSKQKTHIPIITVCSIQ